MKLNFFKKNITPRKVSQQFQAGFTLIEMLMVVAIFIIISAVVMFNYGHFNSQTIMTNMAYEVALTTRQAQVYSLGVRGGADSGGDFTDFDNRYGIYIDLTKGDEANKKFIFFVDGDQDGLCKDWNGVADCFACLNTGDCINKYTLTRDIFIDKICASETNDPVNVDGSCNEPLANYNQQYLTVTFERPNPDAKIRVDQAINPPLVNSAAIILKTKYGDQRAVIIQGTGQISVEFLEDASN